MERRKQQLDRCMLSGSYICRTMHTWSLMHGSTISSGRTCDSCTCHCTCSIEAHSHLAPCRSTCMMHVQHVRHNRAQCICLEVLSSMSYAGGSPPQCTSMFADFVSQWVPKLPEESQLPSMRVDLLQPFQPVFTTTICELALAGRFPEVIGIRLSSLVISLGCLIISCDNCCCNHSCLIIFLLLASCTYVTMTSCMRHACANLLKQESTCLLSLSATNANACHKFQSDVHFTFMSCSNRKSFAPPDLYMQEIHTSSSASNNLWAKH